MAKRARTTPKRSKKRAKAAAKGRKGNLGVLGLNFLPSNSNCLLKRFLRELRKFVGGGIWRFTAVPQVCQNTFLLLAKELPCERVHEMDLLAQDTGH